MKKKWISIILISIIILGLTGCETKNKGKSTDILKEHGKEIFSVKTGNKVCVPVQLTIYEDNNYELFTEYKTCKPGKICTSELIYTKSIKGKYEYDISKIINNSVNLKDKSHSMDNLPQYEIYMGQSYIEQGYSYHYSIEKKSSNEFLDELLEILDINLHVCAKPNYIK